MTPRTRLRITGNPGALCLAVWWLAAAVWAHAEPTVPTTVRVASYNVENYLTMDRMVDDRWRTEYPKPEREKAALREIVLKVAPDVLALQEMGSSADLEELQGDLHKLGLDYPHAFLMEGPDRVRRTAVLSRLPFARVHPHTEVDFAYLGGRENVKRGLLEVVFETAGESWHLYVVHLKSRWTEHAEDPRAQLRRTREAQACRDLIRTRQPPETQPRYVVAGDFNDTRNSATMRRFLQVTDTILTRMAACADGRDERWTYHWEREDVYERIDYLLASPVMYERIVDGRGWIFDTQPMAMQASDHRLIYIDLKFTPKTD